MKPIYSTILEKKQKGEKLFCVLIDPEKFNEKVIHECNKYCVDFIFVGGSTVSKKDFENTLKFIRKKTKIPVIIFPGDTDQISDKADALLFLSLISGRNPEYLIGKQVDSAMKIRKSKLQAISTGYILTGGGKKSTTQRVSGTRPISVKDIKLIISTAVAGEMMGMKLIYLEAGSGAKNSVPSSLISIIQKNITVPLIVGGGIDSRKKAESALKAGADLIVVGNAIENNLFLIKEISSLFSKHRGTP